MTKLAFKASGNTLLLLAYCLQIKSDARKTNRKKNVVIRGQFMFEVRGNNKHLML